METASVEPIKTLACTCEECMENGIFVDMVEEETNVSE